MTRKQGNRRRDLRTTLVKIATKTLIKKGKDGLTMRGLARAAGVSHAAAYRHFEDKSDLLDAVAEEGFKELAACARNAASDRYKDPAGALNRMCVAYVQFAIDNSTLYRLMFGQGSCEMDKAPGLIAAQIAAFGELLDVARVGQAVRVFQEGDSQRMAQTVWALAHGISLCFIEIGMPVETSLAEFVNTSVRWLLDGIRRHP